MKNSPKRNINTFIILFRIKPRHLHLFLVKGEIKPNKIIIFLSCLIQLYPSAMTNWLMIILSSRRDIHMSSQALIDIYIENVQKKKKTNRIFTSIT